MDKEQKAILRLREAARMSQQLYEKPLLLTYSGGKDSDVELGLALKSGIDFEVVHSHTTADMPETVYHVRKKFRELELRGIKCDIAYPIYNRKPVSMWTLIPQKRLPPTHLMRYCCSVLKETAGKGRFIATGVRRAESRNRSDRESFEILGKNKSDAVRLPDEVFMDDNGEQRRLFETCKLKSKRTVNPIIDWTDNDVWDYIGSENIMVNPKYCDGYSRIGCVGCPLAAKKVRWRNFADYPIYQKNYIRAFGRMLQARKAAGLLEPKQGWKTGTDVFNWWIENDVLDGQISLLE